MPRRPTRIVVALGGNALEGPPGDVHAQAVAARRAINDLGALWSSEHVLVVHGNGPQVGTLMLRSEGLVDGVRLPSLPLDTCVADTIGGLGYMLGRELRNSLARRGDARPVAAMITTTVVEPTPDDPLKPVGPRFAASEAQRLEDRGWALRPERGGWVRRVVPSPPPRRILEIELIASLYEAGAILVAGGGGGVPVVEGPDGQFVGVESVVDKDRVAAMLAIALGAALLVILTDVRAAYVDWGEASERPLSHVTTSDLRPLIARGAFGEGSMAPKVEAACAFADTVRQRAVICHLDEAHDGVIGRAGTQITSG